MLTTCISDNDDDDDEDEDDDDGPIWNLSKNYFFFKIILTF